MIEEFNMRKEIFYSGFLMRSEWMLSKENALAKVKFGNHSCNPFPTPTIKTRKPKSYGGNDKLQIKISN